MRPENPTIVKHIQSELASSDYFFLISYQGMSVKKQEVLKAQLREKGAKLQVHKNALIQKACEGTAYADLSGLELNGGTAVAYGAGEAPVTAKVIQSFAKDNDKVVFKAAFFEGQVLKGKSAEGVADMLTKDQARASLLRLLKEPAAMFVRVLNARAEKLNETAQ
jgi:large subunit ribosomal protein L10